MHGINFEILKIVWNRKKYQIYGKIPPKVETVKFKKQETHIDNL